jgi:CubicO group peptidase (beta-lactamase class C family)
MKTYYPALFALLWACGSQPQTANQSEATSTIVTETVKARIDSTLNTFVDSERVAGISALIFEKNTEVYYNTFGFSDRKAGTPMARNTIVRIYSMTKPVTGVALMQLYEDGAFELDDPLEKYAPEFKDMKVFKGVDLSGNLILEPARRPITIRDITRHTAGFVNAGSIPAGLESLVQDADVMNFDNSLTEMARKLGSLPLAFHPGERWLYGSSVDVQAFLVERLSGKPFDQYLQANILDPLSMSSTRYFVPEEDINRLAVTYRRDDRNLVPQPNGEPRDFNTNQWALTPGGFGLTSTIDDYMRFARMLVNEGTLDNVTILKPETVKLMATNHLSEEVTERMWLPSKGQVGFGIDFAVRLRPPASEDENHGIVGEFFWDGAASTLFWVDPVNELTAVLFVQILPFDREVHKKFRDAIYGKYVAERKVHAGVLRE